MKQRIPRKHCSRNQGGDDDYRMISFRCERKRPTAPPPWLCEQRTTCVRYETLECTSSSLEYNLYLYNQELWQYKLWYIGQMKSD